MTLHSEDIGNGFPIVFLHAFPLDGRMWESTVNSVVSAGYRAIVIDLPGFGKSEDPMISIPDAANSVLRLLSKLNVGRFGLCGLSMGGYVSFEIIRKRQNKVAFAILCDTTAEPDSDDKRIERFEAVEEIGRVGTDLFTKNMAKSLLSRYTLENDPILSAEILEFFRRAKPNSLIAALRAMAARNSSVDLLSMIKFPVFLVFGEDDPMLPAGKSMLRSIRTSELSVVEKAGHFSNLEAPGAFNDAVLQYLEGISLD